jgi:Tfp pilus assembly protein PilF
LKNNETESAYNDLQKAIEIDATSPYNHFYMGKYFEKKWQHREALEQYEKAKEMGIEHHGIDFEIEAVKKRIK